MKRMFLLVLPVFAASGALSAPIGNAISVFPQASLESLSGTATLGVGGSVEPNNRVITGEIGETRLKFLDSSTLDIGSNAAVTLDEFIYSDKKATRAALTMTKGAFRWVTGKSPKEAYDLKTPLASIGIRGTDFRVDTDEKRTTIRLRSGAVHACNRVSNTCATINRPGQGVHLDADGKVEMFEERAQAIPPVLRRASATPPRSGPTPQRAQRAPIYQQANINEPPPRMGRMPRAPRQPRYEPDDYADEYIPPRRRPPIVIVDPARPRPPSRLCGYPLIATPDGRCIRPPTQTGCRPPKVYRPGLGCQSPYARGDGGYQPPRGPYGDGGYRPPRPQRPPMGYPRPERPQRPNGGPKIGFEQFIR